MGPADPGAMQATVTGSPRHAKYAAAVDRESARERLAARLEEGARKAEAEAAAKEPAKAPRAPRAEPKDDGGLVSDVVRSPAFKDFMRTAAREIARGMFGSGRR
jgi:hypothetical protein